jgi:hypothetical protein
MHPQQWETVFSVGSEQRSYLKDEQRYEFSFLIKGGTTKEKKNESLGTEQIYGHGSQRGSMPRVTVLAGCRQQATAMGLVLSSREKIATQSSS